MGSTGHTSVETLRGYIDDARLFTDPPATWVCESWVEAVEGDVPAEF